MGSEAVLESTVLMPRPQTQCTHPYDDENKAYERKDAKNDARNDGTYQILHFR